MYHIKTLNSISEVGLERFDPANYMICGDEYCLEGKGYTFVSAEIEMVPQNYIKLDSEDDIKMMTKLLDMMEDNEDVQNVWHNWDQE